MTGDPRVHLVFGATGQVGFDLVRELAPTGRVIGLSRGGKIADHPHQLGLLGQGPNFLRTMLRLGRGQDPVRVVSDQVGAPTWSRELARGCGRLTADFGTGDMPTGLVHLTSAGSCSWFEFACCIRDRLIQVGFEWKPDLLPVTTRDYGARARRPANSVLANDRIRRLLGKGLGDWRSSLTELLVG